MTIGTRIAQRLTALGGRQRGFTQAWLAAQVGVSQPTINGLIHRPQRSSKHLYALATALETNVAWLVGASDDPTPEVSRESELIRIPLIKLGYSAGDGSIFDDYQTIGSWPADRAWADGLAQGAVEALFMARNRGDAMVPTLIDEDLVLIDTAQNVFTGPEPVWAIRYAGLAFCKRLVPRSETGFEIVSDNPAIAPIEASSDRLEIIGRVVWIGRILES